MNIYKLGTSTDNRDIFIADSLADAITKAINHFGCPIGDIRKYGQHILCPRCEKNYYTPVGEHRYEHDPPLPSISRADNSTSICDACGTDEAMEDFFDEGITPIDSWPVKRNYEVTK